jgi:thiamine biosynthesis lipoprotein
MSVLDRSIGTMGVTARLVLADRAPGAKPSERLEHAANAAEALLQDLHAKWTRFDDDSLLNQLSRAPRTTIPAPDDHLRALIRAGAYAGRVSGGLVDITLGAGIARAGYQGHWDQSLSVPIDIALAAAPPRAAAQPDPHARWQALAADNHNKTINKPQGVHLDSGGIGKGLAADLVAQHLTGLRYIINIGGDIALGHGGGGAHEVEVVHPLTRRPVHVFRLGTGGVATSGIHRRVWVDRFGDPAHHLLDPSTQRPAWTGLLAATAVGRTALEAEVLAKTAYLKGPNNARRTLAALGGVLVHEDGRAEVIPALRLAAQRAARTTAAATPTPATA